VKVVSTTCLPVADESIKNKAIDALDTCIIIIGSELTEENALAAASNSKSILSEDSLPPFF
jgi:hypothetical protein